MLVEEVTDNIAEVIVQVSGGGLDRLTIGAVKSCKTIVLAEV